MLILLLLSIPLIGILIISTKMYYNTPLSEQDKGALIVDKPSRNNYEGDLITNKPSSDHDMSALIEKKSSSDPDMSALTANVNALTTNIYLLDLGNNRVKATALKTSVLTLLVSLIIFAFFDLSSNQFQFVQEYYEINSFNLYLGIDGLSIYFVLLTTIIIPISLLSNWKSISENLKLFLIAILLLEVLLLSVFLVLDILLYYIFFESILPPLFILIGSFGSSNRVRASFYLFLYTFIGSLFLLLSIISMSSITGITDFDALYKINFDYYTQIFLFCGIFIAFAVKTPIIFLNTWLLKAHVESPLSGSIILAAIVLKLSLYGILRLILPLLPKVYINYTFLVYVIGVITIIYASISTLRTIDVKELIAYSSVSHAAVYLMSVFSNIIQGIEGAIILGLAHGFVSSGLFICAGGVLYDRSSTRLITYYRGMAQIMPLFSVVFFILCLGNCGTPLTLNFVGEFLSLYGAFVRSPLLGVLASSSIIFSAAYTIYMFNRIAFAGSYSKFFKVNIPDLNKREFYILLTLVLFTLVLGIYPAVVLDGLHYSVTTLLYSFFEGQSTLTNGGYLFAFIPLFRNLTKKIHNLMTNISKLVLLVLSSPPKPHAFVSLPIQSNRFNKGPNDIHLLLFTIIYMLFVWIFLNFFDQVGTFESKVLLTDSNIFDGVKTFNPNVLFFDNNNPLEGSSTDHGGGEPVEINPVTGQDHDCDIDPSTGFDRSVKSEVATANPNCEHSFEADPFGGVNHGTQENHTWYHEPQQKYDDYVSDCNYCGNDVTSESVNVKVICTDCEKAAHVDCLPSKSSGKSTTFCDNIINPENKKDN